MNKINSEMVASFLYKAFYAVFLVTCFFCFVHFPLGYYFNNFSARGDSLVVIALTAGLIASFIVVTINLTKPYCRNNKVWLSLLNSRSCKFLWAPFIIFLLLMALKCGVASYYCMESVQISDFALAFYNSQRDIPIYENYYRIFSNWGMYSLWLRGVAKIFGLGVNIAVISNTLLNVFSSILIYYICLSIKSNRNYSTAILAALLYGLYPANFFYVTLLSPEHVFIFTMLVGLLCLQCAYNIPLKLPIRIFLISISAVIISFSGFMKAIDKIVVISLGITLLLMLLSSTHMRREAKAWFQNVVKLGLLYGMVFLSVYISSTYAFYEVLDYYVGYQVNRNPSLHYMYLGLNSRTQGAWSPEEGGNYGRICEEVNYDFQKVNQQVGRQLLNDIRDNHHITLLFIYNKLKTAFEGQNYMAFVEDSIAPEKADQVKNLLGQVAPFMQLYYLFVGLLGTIGVADLYKRKNTPFLICCLYVFGFILLMILSENQPRYKVVIYPALSMLAAYAISVLAECRNKQFKVNQN